jgi:hypothetical protein
MFLLTVIIATTNFVLGYGLAVALGWAKMPEFGTKTGSDGAAVPPAGH